MTSLRTVARHRPGLYLLTAMTVVTAIVCRTPVTIASSVVSLLILAGFLAYADRVFAGRTLADRLFADRHSPVADGEPA